MEAVSVYFSDTVWFHFNRCVKPKRVECEAVKIRTPFCRTSVTCTYGVQYPETSDGGPIFLYNRHWRSLIYQCIALMDDNEKHCWFQRDDEAAHTANERMNDNCAGIIV